MVVDEYVLCVDAELLVREWFGDVQLLPATTGVVVVVVNGFTRMNSD